MQPAGDGSIEQVGVLEGIKHTLVCNCILPQLLHVEPPVFHRFVVFSVVENGMVKPSHAQCTNCRGVHKVTEIGVSSKLPTEDSDSLVQTIEEIQASLPEKLVSLLTAGGTKYNMLVDNLPTWQEIQFHYNNELWGKPTIIAKTVDKKTAAISGKLLLLAGKTLWTIQPFTSSDGDF